MGTVIASAIQMCSGEDKDANLATAERLVEQAAGQGARLVVLPETFNCCGRSAVMVAQAETIPGPTIERLARRAAAAKVYLVCGSVLEKSPEHGKACNTSVALGPDGSILAAYRKMHLFDVDLPGRVTVRESAWLARGDELATFATDFGVVGMSICYDLRFPELYRALVAR
ncbi:MAG: carbon-nitrogen hydrolase family protein, partial [Planctomycetes bacterium]|nr:carbon-nitrogen hydrolase family protein [Planctomycetota bacterium]